MFGLLQKSKEEYKRLSSIRLTIKSGILLKGRINPPPLLIAGLEKLIFVFRILCYSQTACVFYVQHAMAAPSLLAPVKSMPIAEVLYTSAAEFIATSIDEAVKNLRFYRWKAVVYQLKTADAEPAVLSELRL